MAHEVLLATWIYKTYIVFYESDGHEKNMYIR